jgi:hypothetical protein
MCPNITNPCRFDRPEQSEGSGEIPKTLLYQTLISVKDTLEGSLDFARDDTGREFENVLPFLGEYAIVLAPALMSQLFIRFLL